MKARSLFALYWLALWLAQVLPVRVIAEDALDPSWSQALGRFLAQGLLAGQDYVFTYGPLGYFSTNVYEPALFWHKLLLWEVGWRLAASWFVARALWDGHSRTERVAAFALLLVVPLTFDAFAFAVIVAVASVLAREPQPRALVRGLGFLLLGSLALVKFTFAVAAGATALALVLHSLASTGRRAALRDSALALFGLVACWFAAGQGLSNFWPWLHNSLRIAAGYNEGESKPAGAFSTWIGLATLACAFVLLVQLARARPRSRARAALAAALALDCFLSFKAGYVRGDDHTTHYLGFALVACWLLPLAPPAKARAGLGALAALLALAGILAAPEQEGTMPTALLRDFVARLPQNAHDMLLPWRAHAELEAARSASAARFDLPRIRARVGKERVDVFNFHQGVALLNGLEYVPRPLFQSYVAFTPELQQLDVDFYEGARAPRFVLFKLETIDDRLPTMEHARLLETFLRWYAPVLSEHRELLLERRETPLPPVQRTLEIEREVAFGEELALPAAPSPARLLTLDLRARPLGKLAQFLYRAPEIELESLDEFGNRRRLRVVPGMMRTGVLFDPYVTAGDSWVQFLVGGRLPRLRSLRVVLPPGWEWMYEPRFGLRLESTQGYAPPQDDALARELDAFVFERMPDGLQVSRPALRFDYGGRDCYFVFAPASMLWTLPAGKHSLSAFFGMSSDPRRVPFTPKACFRVALVDGGQPKLLLERWIDLSKPEDRSIMKVDLDFEAAKDCQLVLVTALPPEDTLKNAWCFWSEVKLR
jgi:hypothetical protein